MEHVWHRIQTLLQQSLNPGLFKVWIKPLEATIDDARLDLFAPNEFVAAWVRDRLLDSIRQAAAEIMGCEPAVSISARQVEAAQIASAAASPRRTPRNERTKPQETAVPLGLPMVPKARVVSSRSWRFSFDDFVVGPSNELAFAASTGLCRQTLASDQLFICSSSGLGKTHLLQAIGHELAQASNKQSIRVAYLTAEEFATKMVMAIKAREVEAFKAQLREGVDLLLLEDIHFFQGKEKMQDELVSTLKALKNRGSKIVLTSSFLPRELSHVDNQLVSRFCDGLLTVIAKPDFSTRMRIVQDKAKRRYHTLIPDDVSALLADHIQTDIRQLESCLQNLVLKAQLLGRTIGMDLAWDVLQTYGVEGHAPNIDRILEFICQCYDLSAEQLRSKSRKRTIVLARNTAFYLARKHTDLSLKDIGCRFNRTHSTVLKGITNIEMEISRDTPLGRQIQNTIGRLDA